MPKNTNHDIYYAVIQNENDPFLTHIIGLHGPFSIEKRYDNSEGTGFDLRSIDMCLACNVVWPCHTFTIFLDRHNCNECD